MISFWMLCTLRHWLFWNMCFAFHPLYFWLERLSTVLLWAHLWAESLDYPICRIKYCWRSVDTQYHDGVTYVSWVIWIEKAATTFVSELLPHCYTKITQDRAAIILDTALTLIIRRGQYLVYEWLQPNVTLFCQGRLPLHRLWIAVTRSLFKYHTYKTKDRWRSIDAHFQDGAGGLIQSFLIWKAANTSLMNGCN